MDPAPIPMPSRGHSARPWAEQVGRTIGQCLGRTRVEGERLAELLRASRTREGRQRHLAPLLLLAVSSGFVLGLGLGLRRHR